MIKVGDKVVVSCLSCTSLKGQLCTVTFIYPRCGYPYEVRNAEGSVNFYKEIELSLNGKVTIDYTTLGEWL